MGICKYCGKSAGLLRSKHLQCEEQEQRRNRTIEAGRHEMAAEITKAITVSGAFDALEKRLTEIEQTSSIPSADRIAIQIGSWETAVDRFLDDGVLETGEEARLAQFTERFSLRRDQLDRNGALTKIVKAGVLRDVLNGKIPQRVSVDGHLPINFQKREKMVWVFPNSDYLEDKTRRQFVGGSQGVSMRVMKGVYYRVGVFKGHPIEHTERIHVDSGWFVVTDKNLYFAGSRKSLRIPFPKIISFEPFSDGIGVMRDAATAKPQIFITGDGWFTYNLVTNVARL